MNNRVIKGYEAEAPELIARYEAVSPKALLAPVAQYLPEGGKKIIDLGAGTGRAAAWFADQGHRVLAVEPVAAFRKAGRALHKSAKIEWLADRLPDLGQTFKRCESFDLVLLSAVWHHLTADQRRCAIPKLWDLTAPGGRLVISLRHGPGAALRPSYEAPADALIDLAGSKGFGLLLRQSADSAQVANRAAGVSWTWLVFAKDG